MKKLLVTTALAGALIASSTASFATLQVAFSVDGNTFACSDGDACDGSATAGVIALGSETLDGVTIFGTFAASQTGPDLLRAINFSISNGASSSKTLLMAVGDDGYTGTAGGFAGSAAGLWTGAAAGAANNAAYGFWVDGTNVQGAANSLDTPGTNILDFLTNHSTGFSPNSFSDNATASFGASGPFSMTMGANFTLASGSSLSGNEQAIEAVPELSTWGMAALGFGLVGLVAIGAKRRDERSLVA